MNKTKIPWATHTWSPITGCSPISEGCENCYAKAMSKRFGWKWGEPQFHPERLSEPMKVKKPAKIFVCSMSDLFHEKVSQIWIDRIFQSMFDAIYEREHTFIILTKRPENMRRYFKKWASLFRENADVMDKIWIGVTVENQKRADERIPILLDIPAKVRFVSAEPLLEKIDIHKYLDECVAYCRDCRKIVESDHIHYEQENGIDEVCKECRSGSLEYYPGIDWVIAGGETGPGARRCEADWIIDIDFECEEANVPFFFKQWGSNVLRYEHDYRNEHETACKSEFPKVHNAEYVVSDGL